MKIQDFINKGITIVNSMGEVRETRHSSIVFPNGRVASIVIEEDNYSIATCDYDGYFNWDILKPFGASKDGVIICKTEDEVCKALAIIESL